MFPSLRVRTAGIATTLALAALVSTADAGVGQAPPSTDVYVGELSQFDGVYFVGALQNVTNRPTEYDNQPAFTPDSRSVLFTRAYDDGNDGQTEIHRYYIDSGRTTRITRSAVESEYSATPIPNDRLFSAVRVEADSTQRLWRFTMEGMDAEVLLRDIAPVGYHAWGDDDTLLLFVLGQPPTLQIANVSTGRGEVLAENPGRSLHKIPTRAAFSFPQRTDGETWISEVAIGSREITPILRAVDDGQDHAWTPDGVVLMASGGVLYQHNPEVDDGWRQIADFRSEGLTFSRLAVSPDGTKLAIVGQQAEGGAGGGQPD